MAMIPTTWRHQVSFIFGRDFGALTAVFVSTPAIGAVIVAGASSASLISAPAPAKPAPPLPSRLRQAYGSYPLRRRQSRHLRSLLASVKPTAHIRSGAGKAGTSAPCSPPSSLRLVL